MYCNEISSVIGSALLTWDFVMNVDVFAIKERLSTVRTLGLLVLDDPLHRFGILPYLPRVFCSLLKVVFEIRIIRAGIPLNQGVPLNPGIADAIKYHARVFVHKAPLTAGVGRMMRPVTAVTPPEGLIGMGFANPASEFPEEVVFQVVKHF